MHAPTVVPAICSAFTAPASRGGHDGEFVRVAPGDPDPHMPNTAEITEARPVVKGPQRVRKRRDNLVPLLEELAFNLRWSWDPETLDLFQSLAPGTHTPIA